MCEEEILELIARSKEYSRFDLFVSAALSGLCANSAGVSIRNAEVVARMPWELATAMIEQETK
jgi:hypothetical protein